jgi:hypothetical protein
MSSNEKLEINGEFPSFILNAPRFKYKMPIITPTPFSLNDSDSDDENDLSTVGNTSFDEQSLEGFINFQNDDKTVFTKLTLK